MLMQRKIYIFTGVAVLLFGGLVVGAASRQGWLSPKIKYFVEFPSGDGLHPGTPVSISGLKAGKVTLVELQSNNQVRVELSLQKKFSGFVKADSVASVGRPFIIGEKAVAVSLGSKDARVLNEGEMIRGVLLLELTDILSGERMGPYLNAFAKLLDQLKVLVEGDTQKDSNAIPLLDFYKQTYRGLVAIEKLSTEVSTIRHDLLGTPYAKQLIKQLAESTRNLDKVMAASAQALPAMTQLSTEVVHLMPELNRTLSETVFTLQAMQKSFLLRGGVKELRKEQEAVAKEQVDKSLTRSLATDHPKLPADLSDQKQDASNDE